MTHYWSSEKPLSGQHSLSGHILQRACACGSHAPGGECAGCKARRLQRAGGQSAPDLAPPIVHDVLASPGQPLDSATRAFMEPRFGQDFSRVRVHADARAADSATVVNALAYTAGNHIAFGPGQYAPRTNTGQRLLAHELTHVVQQEANASGALVQHLSIEASDTPTEHEAERVAAELGAASMASFAASSIEHARVMCQRGGAGGRQAPQQADPVERARASAWLRCHRAYERLAGLSPLPPRGRYDPAEIQQRRAQRLARLIFREDLNMNQVQEIVGSMRDRLGPGLATVRAPATDQECGGLRAAYVVNYRPPVHLCPQFYTQQAHEQMVTLIHEAAHLAKIGEGSGNEYCFFSSCDEEATCGGFNFADSWTQYVMCLSE